MDRFLYRDFESWVKYLQCFLTSILLLISLPCIGQNIQVFIHLQPNLPPSISEWEIDPNLTNIELFAILQEPLVLEVQVEVHEFSLGTVLTAESLPIQANPGSWQLRINNTEILDWESLDYAPEFENDLGQSGRLPDGDYEICAYVRRFQDPGGIVLGESCMNFTIESQSPPVLHYPIAETVLTEPLPLFQWSYGGYSPGVAFSLNIVEVLPGQMPEEATETNPTIFNQSSINQLLFLFDQAEGLLIPCHTYAVWVEVENGPGLDFASPSLRSEAVPFYWQTGGEASIQLSEPGSACVGSVNSAITTTMIDFNWIATGPFSSFNVVTCPNPCGTFTPGLTTTTTTSGAGIPIPTGSGKITYSDPRNPYGVPLNPGNIQRLPSLVSDVIAGSGQGLNQPYHVANTLLARTSIQPCETEYYFQTVDFQGVIEPGAAITWYVVGVTSSGTTVTSPTFCERYSPTTSGGETTTNVPCPGCQIKSEKKPGPAISVSIVAPVIPKDSTPDLPKIPLALLAWDKDDEIQKCLCLGRYIEKKIEIVDPITYEWTLEGNGKLQISNGPSNLYETPTLEVGHIAKADIICRTIDYLSNDGPAWGSYSVEVKRTGECLYEYTVMSSTHSEGSPSATPTGAPPPCLPQKEEWNPTPSMSAGFAGEIRVGVGERILLKASGTDADELKIICSGECGYAFEKIPEMDELIYYWSATHGGFPDHGGSAVTNSWNTSVIYRAPETPGVGEIKVRVTDTGQGPDGSLDFTCMLLVAKVDLEIDGVTEENEECNGRCLNVNLDDDNESKIKDLDEKKVDKEDDLVKITLKQEQVKGDIVLKANYGGERIKVWKEKTKEEEIVLPKTYKPEDLPVTLWVEGILPSKKQCDIELELKADDPVCHDKGRLTAIILDLDADTNRDGNIDNKDDADEAKNVDYLKTGALVLANLDDDNSVQKPDTADDVITSEKDFGDFSKMIVRKMTLPEGWSGQLQILEGGEHIRVFKELKKDAKSIMGYVNGQATFPIQYTIPTADLEKGDVAFYIEGISPGKEATIVLQIAKKEFVLDICEDTVRIMVTPLIFHSNLQPTKRVFFSDWQLGGLLGNEKFVKVFKEESGKIVGAVNVVSILEKKSGGIFAQDIFEIGYQKNPSNHEGKLVIMPTVLDNPWQIHGLSSYPELQLLKPDFGLQRGTSSMSSGPEYVDLEGGDYGGNLEAIPPFQNDLPFGQLIIGDNMQTEMKEFLIDQKVQAKDGKTLVILPVDPKNGSVVFHVDEVCNIVPSSKDKKFKVVVGDIDSGINLLKASTSNELKTLRDKYVTKKNEDLAIIKGISDQLFKIKDILKKDGGLAESDIVRIPVLYPFEFTEGYGLPNAVNLQVVDNKIFIPNPIYDKAKGTVFMPMQKEIIKQLGNAGVNVKDIIFVNTTQMSGYAGEAHCATNAERKVPK